MPSVHSTPLPSDGETGCSFVRRLAASAAAIHTVIQTCKANGVNPQAYIADVIRKVAADWPAARWDELMPWNWGPQTGEPVAQAA